jgi:hypothetical protein
MLKKFLLIGGGSALLLLCTLFGAFFAGPLLASARNGQTNTAASSTPTTNPYCEQYLPGIANQVAQGLHMTVDQLKTQLQSGKSLIQIATTQGVSSSQLQTLVTSAIQNAVNKAGHDGNLTQQQATDIMQMLQKHPGQLLKATSA